MDFCEELDDIKACFAEMTGRFAIDATYGNNTRTKLYELARMASYIHTLEDNVTEYKQVKLGPNNLAGKYVSMSVLTKSNNILFLDTTTKSICTTVEVRPCLSDSEICEIIAQAQSLCYYCN